MKNHDLMLYFIEISLIVLLLGTCTTIIINGTHKKSDSSIYLNGVLYGQEGSGKYVDKAMSLKGAILLSPKDDLVKLGLFTVAPNVPITIHTCSPSIAVLTKKKWCVWGLGWNCGIKINLKNYHVLVDGNPQVEIIGSAIGYKSAEEDFEKCVKE